MWSVPNTPSNKCKIKISSVENNSILDVSDSDFTITTPLGIGNFYNPIPKSFVLYQNYPNSSNPKTTINYSVPKSNIITIKVYDILGREAKTLVNEQKAPGNYIIEFNANKLSSGVYFYQLRVGDFISTKKMVLFK